MTYIVKEIFYSIQGEGARSGRPAVFCRFSGCNLWNGLEKDRLKAACRFCDTDFMGTGGVYGGRYATAKALVDQLLQLWPLKGNCSPYIVCTGGEPLLQLDDILINYMHQKGCEVGLETNGTMPVPPQVDWVCVSPKANADLLVLQGDELKLIYPQASCVPEDYLAMNFSHFYLQPMDNEQYEENVQAALTYCKQNPRWNLSLQLHKLLNIM